MVEALAPVDARFREGEKQDLMDYRESTAVEVIRKLAPELQPWQRISNGVSPPVLGMTILWFALTIG